MNYLHFDKANKYLTFGFCLFLTLLIGGASAWGQQSYKVISSWQEFTDAPNAMYHDLADQAYIQLEKRDSIVSELRTLSDWKQRQQWAKKTLEDIVGPFPERTPLNARITKRIKKEDYTIEDIIYESQPKFYVTASLFIPTGLKGKAPAIVYCSGHTNKGYKESIYQHVILNLVKKGFIVFAFDPVGQGERLQYYDPQTGKSTVGGPTHEHSYPGAQAFITGSSQARYEIWDGIRAVDYLLTRKEVDPDRIGITGRSGGGTQSAYIAAFDDRIYAAAPENYITNFTRLIEAIGPQDAEQNFYHEIVRGIDHPDLLEVRAPKPTLMITTTRDFFPIQGAMETEKEVSRIFEAYGKPANFYRVEFDTIHASNKKNRESMYAFFQKYLDNPGDSTDLDVAPLTHGELQVTKTGQVSTSIKDAETVFSLNLKEAKKKEAGLQALRKDLSGYLPEALDAARTLSGYRDPDVFHKPVFTGRYRKSGYVIEKHFVKGEGDYVIPYILMIPDAPNGKGVICLGTKGKSEELANGDMEWFVKRGYTVLAPDLLGVGELGKGEYKGDSFINNTSYGVWYLSILTGRSIVGVRAGDVVRLARLLKRTHQVSEVYGLARAGMTSVLLYAAAFDTAISRVLLLGPYSSYRSVVMNRFYDPSFIYGAVSDALGAYDLPDLAASLAPRELMMVNVVDGQGKPISDGEGKADFSVIREAYNNRKASGRFNIIHEGSLEKPYDLFAKWIQ